METVIKTTLRQPLAITLHPYLMDHRVEGKAVFPAVEAMQVLAEAVRAYRRDMNIHLMENASFLKFLYLKSEQPKLELFNDVEVHEDGRVVSKLVSITKAGTITRTKIHVVISYPNSCRYMPPFVSKNMGQGGAFEIPPEKVYHELVPFGPAYHNIIRLRISEHLAMAEVKSGTIESGCQPLGSSFPLDAAFHAACVWGQRFSSMVGFPTGFQQRVIRNPTQPGNTYQCTIIPLQIGVKTFTVNIRIQDVNDALHEELSGVEMTDISAGRMKPPQWLMEMKSEQ